MNLTYTATNPKTSQGQIELSIERAEEIVRELKSITPLLGYYCSYIRDTYSHDISGYAKNPHLARKAFHVKNEVRELCCMILHEISVTHPSIDCFFDHKKDDQVIRSARLKRRTCKPHDQFQAARAEDRRDIAVNLPLINCLINNICVDIFFTYSPDVIGSRKIKSLSMKALQVRDIMQSFTIKVKQEFEKTYPKESFIQEFGKVHPQHMVCLHQIVSTEPESPSIELRYNSLIGKSEV